MGDFRNGRFNQVAVIVLSGLGLGAVWLLNRETSGSISHALGRYPASTLIENALWTWAILSAAYLALSRQKPTHRITVVAVPSLTLLAVVVAIELPAMVGWYDYRRLLVPKMPGASGPHNRVYHRDGPPRRPPGDSFTTRQAGAAAIVYDLPAPRVYRAAFRYDAYGFRNSENRDRADVVLIGDSFVEGVRVTQEQIVSSVLEALINRAVVNLGQADYGPMEELVTLEKFGLPLRPEWVVWFIFEGNDLVPVGRPDQKYREAYAAERSFRRRSLIVNGLEYAIRTVNLTARESRGPYRYGRLPLGNERGAMYFEIPMGPLTPAQRTNLLAVQDVIVDAHRKAAASGPAFSSHSCRRSSGSMRIS